MSDTEKCQPGAEETVDPADSDEKSSGQAGEEAHTSISKRKLLVVEGKSASIFFNALLSHLKLAGEIEVRDACGVDDLKTYLPLLVSATGFSNVESLGIVRDAESDDASSAFKSVLSALRKAQKILPTLATPVVMSSLAEGQPNVAVFILPDCAHPGMLETLCLDSVNHDPSIKCIDSYFECLAPVLPDEPRPEAKARLHAFLASRKRPDLQLGSAARKGYFPLDNEAFGSLKAFLRQL